jgi:hypothetical protein
MFDRGTRPAPRIIGVLSAGLLVAALAVSTYAAIPSAGGVYTACKDSVGNIKVIDAEKGATCPAGQAKLTWSQTGPKGPVGPVGPQGATGATGDRGPSDAYRGADYGSTPLSTDSAAQTLVKEWDIPQGEYVVFADLTVVPTSGLANVPPEVVSCTLTLSYGGGTVYGNGEATVASNANGDPTVASMALSVAYGGAIGGKLAIRCWATGPDAVVTNVHVNAIQVGARHSLS